MTEEFNPQNTENKSQGESQDSPAKRRRTKDYKALDDLFNQAVKKSRSKRITTYASKKQHTLKSEQTSSFVSTPRKVEALSTGEIDTELVNINLNKKMTVSEWRINELEKNLGQDSSNPEGEESNTDVIPVLPEKKAEATLDEASKSPSSGQGDEKSQALPDEGANPKNSGAGEAQEKSSRPRPSDETRPEFIGFEEKEQALIDDFFKTIDETPKKEKPVDTYTPPESFDLGLIPERPFDEDELIEADIDAVQEVRPESSGLGADEIESLLDFFTRQNPSPKKEDRGSEEPVLIKGANPEDQASAREKTSSNQETTTFILPQEKEKEDAKTVFIDDNCSTQNLQELLSDIQLNLESCSGDDWTFSDVAHEIKEEVEEKPDDAVDDTLNFLLEKKNERIRSENGTPSDDDEARFEDFLIEEFNPDEEGEAVDLDTFFTPSPVTSEEAFKKESEEANSSPEAPSVEAFNPPAEEGSEESLTGQVFSEEAVPENEGPEVSYHDLSFQEVKPSPEKVDRKTRISQLKEKFSKDKKKQEKNNEVAAHAKAVYQSVRAESPNPYQGTFAQILKNDPALKNAVIGFSVSIVLLLAFLLVFGRSFTAAGWIMTGLIVVSMILTHELKQLHVYFLIIADILVYLFMMIYMVYADNYQITLSDYLWFILIPLCLMTAFAFFNNYSCWQQDRLHFVRNDRFDHMDDNQTAAEKIDRLTGKLPDLSGAFPDEENKEKTVPINTEEIHQAMVQDQPYEQEEELEDLEFSPEEWLKIDLEGEPLEGEALDESAAGDEAPDQESFAQAGEEAHFDTAPLPGEDSSTQESAALEEKEGTSGLRDFDETESEEEIFTPQAAPSLSNDSGLQDADVPAAEEAHPSAHEMKGTEEAQDADRALPVEELHDTFIEGDSFHDVSLDDLDPDDLNAIMDHLDNLEAEERKQQNFKTFFEDHDAQ